MKSDNGKDVRVEKVKITPSLAEEMLRKNKKNRPIVNSTFERYARDISAGEWRLDGNTIKFDPDDCLLDGQHRLWAVIEAGKPIESFVAYNVPEEAMDTIDTGMKRSTANAMHLRGEQNANQLAGTAALLWKFEKKYLQKSAPVRPTTRESMKVLQENPGLREAVSQARTVRHLVSPVIAAFVFYVTAKKDSSDAIVFFDKLATGEDLLQGSPILALRERLIKNKTSLGKLRQRDLIIVMLKAWNAFREGRKVRTLPIIKKERGMAAESFPQIT